MQMQKVLLEIAAFNTDEGQSPEQSLKTMSNHYSIDRIYNQSSSPKKFYQLLSSKPCSWQSIEGWEENNQHQKLNEGENARRVIRSEKKVNKILYQLPRNIKREAWNFLKDEKGAAEKQVSPLKASRQKSCVEKLIKTTYFRNNRQAKAFYESERIKRELNQVGNMNCTVGVVEYPILCTSSNPSRRRRYSKRNNA